MTTRPLHSLRHLALALAALLTLVPAAFAVAHKRPRHPHRTTHHHRAPHHSRPVSYPKRVDRAVPPAERRVATKPKARGQRTTTPVAPAAAKPTTGAHVSPTSVITASSRGASRSDCVYSANNVATLTRFGAMVGHQFDCAMVFSNANPTWKDWELPWIMNDPRPAYNWQAWATASGTHRQLIITITPFPDSEAGSNWLRAGASGAFDAHARALAENLVRAGLGNSVIRLAHEANDAAYDYSLDDSPADQALWARMWRHEALAMKSVPGAHFLMDWCINARYRAIPLANWYPGNDAVDIVGVDSYDSGVTAGLNRWSTIFGATDGIGTVLAFAKAHGKPVSLPEWGLSPAGTTRGGGDDPAYMNGIAAIVRDNSVAYQSYFFNGDTAAVLKASPQSLAAYRRHFGGGGKAA